jgi:hypothetical protein
MSLSDKRARRQQSSSSCGDARQSLDMRAAKDAKARMHKLHLTEEQATSWFQQHREKVWQERQGCRLP